MQAAQINLISYEQQNHAREVHLKKFERLKRYLESAASEGQIIINEDTYHQVKEFFNCKKIGEVILKNKSQLMNIYEMLD